MTTRSLTVAAAQLGPVPKSASRPDTLARLIKLLEAAATEGAQLVVFPEAALTPFFPHWLVDDDNELLSYYEQSLPSPDTRELFDAARELRVAFVLGYAERTDDDRYFNTAALVDETGDVIHRYRKIHLPGFQSVQDGAPFQNLEKRYFEVGDLGFGVQSWRNTTIGLAICNDRRWAETYRVLALKGAELVCLGYNTPASTPHLTESNDLTDFQNHLSMQAGAYQNSMWVVGTAKAGIEEGVAQIGGSVIIAPSGEIIATARTLGDELVTAEIDLDMVMRYRRDVFNFEQHRRPEHYKSITEPHPRGNTR
ncbi:nitrilase-related carbon-nitrogen hydrolase [Rhodococcus erythropolis]|uniref:Nitrilase-related carbon-nitrogen hydrolase n=1 Tax=Rhodococcus erythropolis TaxID=1833 RepID=A0AAX3ZZ79_RHOER|nr:nitrilase-related carbon-nitrogen hydrolase [Rhodococcus erythropolis]WMN01916.1 nitrilase-related carbon-nitrogen hydrolase [Rhodococcus erythropolis]